MNFLVVDDSKLSRVKISQIIHELGHTVVGEAQNGLEAIEKYRALSPQCITMDLEMPLLSGLEAAEKIFGCGQNAIIILITSVINKRDILHATQIGIRHVLHKPISAEAFASTLQAITKELCQ